MKKKKILIFLALLFINTNVVSASTKVEATLYKCVDGDTAWFTVEGENVKARFLAIDTPESTTTIEEYGKEASEFTCSALTNADEIILEYDDDSDKTDKYKRELVWVWVDGDLLQEELIKNGLAEVKYLYGDYAYTERLENLQEQAKSQKLNIWQDETTTSRFDSYLYFIIGIITIIVLLCSKKGRKKLKTDIKKRLKKALK